MIRWRLKSEEWEGPFPAIPLGKAGSLRHFAPCGEPGTGVEARLTAYPTTQLKRRSLIIQRILLKGAKLGVRVKKRIR
jgi:hypothetical protein